MLPAGQASTPEVFARLLAARAADFQVELSPDALDRLAAFLALLDQARRQTNLTGPLTSEELADHALESVLGGTLVAKGARVVDIGSGGGFPGIPLAIARPDLVMTLVEPRRKRLEFLREASRQAGIANVAALARLADLPPGSASVATARAVGDLERVVGNADFLTRPGALLVWTTNEADLERRLGPRFALERSLPVPGSRQKTIARFLIRPERFTWNKDGKRPQRT